jgi:hypothetical protein
LAPCPTNARNRYEDGSRRLARFRDSLARVADLDEPQASRPLEAARES